MKELLQKAATKSGVLDRGKRIRKIRRMLTGYTRKEFSEHAGISENTIKQWESPPLGRGGITSKGVKKFITALKKLGIICSEDWIMDGIGNPPSLIDVKQEISSELVGITWDEEESILKDIESFKLNNSNPIVIIVTDGSVLPLYFYGDYVGGSKRTGSNIDLLIGSVCIVELENEIVIRKIAKKNQKKCRYTLVAVNEDKSVLNPTINNTAIISAAKIVWHRSRESSKRLSNNK